MNEKDPHQVQKRLVEFDSNGDSGDEYIGLSDINGKPPENRIKGFSGSNPLELAAFLRGKVCRNGSRKYYRFRGGRFYGGIAAADCVGCVLDCVFCWSYKPRCNPDTAGKFYTPKQVVEKLMGIASKNGYNKLRITGNEPTLCREHLLEVLKLVPDDMLFILETNGILLDEEYTKALVPFKHHLHVRVSLKAANSEQFMLITAMDGEFLEYQFNALRYLMNTGISCNAAIMEELLDKENADKLVNTLADIDPSIAQNLEFESLIIYPFIEQELARRNLNKNFKPK
jgi:uncharacterized Fe-S cluster-containing radical SAM superfamily protein